MFFVVERLPPTATDLVNDMKRIASEFVETNAARAAELVQRAREASFVARCRESMMDREYAGASDVLKSAIGPHLPILFSRPAPVDAPLFDSSPSSALRTFPWMINVRANHDLEVSTLEPSLDAYTDRFQEHEYEWVSLISAAFLHHETRTAGRGEGVRSAFSAVRHSLVNLAGALPPTRDGLAAAITLETLCAEGLAALFDDHVVDKRAKGSWSRVFGESFSDLLTAAIGTAEKPLEIDAGLPQNASLDYRFFPLVYELVRNAWGHGPDAGAVRVKVSADSGRGLIDLEITTTAYREDVRAIGARLRSMKKHETPRGLQFIWHFVGALRDPESGGIEWIVDDTPNSSIIAAKSDWCRLRGPLDLDDLPDVVPLTIRAKDLCAILGEQ
jgi:hypothetical protein